MTFTEAAVEVLRREGKPLHFQKIAEIAVRDALLDHVGKIPEETMAGQLAAHCRLPRPERRMMAVQHGTFALVEWGLDEDPAGLDALVEPPPESLLPLRSRERHPVPSRDMARSAGRGEGRGRRREGEPRGKRYPPPAEVAYEILAGAGRPLSLLEVAALGAERLLMPDAFVRDAGSLGAALREDNRRREASGRRALFALDAETVGLAAQPEPGERPAVPMGRAPATPAELRRAGLSAVRRRLRECDAATVEHVAARLLERSGFRELKVAKRGREHVVYTARRRMGLMDVRHCVRVLRGAADAGRRDVTELRRDLGNYGAQIGIVLAVGEAGREARGEAGAAGQLPILLWCGEALAEAMADAGVGTVTVAVPEVDEAFFRAAGEAAAQEEAGRRARRDEREREERGRRRAEPEAGEAPSAREESPAEEAPVEAGAEPEGEEPEGEEEAEGEAEEAGPSVGAAGEEGRGEGRRRRRRRRRRGGRGRAREGAAAEGGAPAESAAPSTAPAQEAAPAPAPEGPAGTGSPPGE